jgi:hypothetical protein
MGRVEEHGRTPHQRWTFLNTCRLLRDLPESLCLTTAFGEPLAAAQSCARMAAMEADFEVRPSQSVATFGVDRGCDPRLI